MKKIKITEAQAKLVKSLTEDEDAHESPLKINKGLRPSTQTTNSFKKETKGLGLKFENKVLNEGITMELIQLAQEVLSFVREVYADPSTKNISPFWQSLGMTAGEVKELLTDVGLMTVATLKGASYFGKKDIVGKIRKLYKKLRQLIFKKKGETKPKAVNTYKTNVEEDNSNLPPGVSNNDPHFNSPNTERPNSTNESLFNVLWFSDDLVILEAKGEQYAYYHPDAEGIENYADREVIGYEQDDEGDHHPEYHEDYDIDEEAIANFVNDNYHTIGLGVGIEGWNNGLITKLDDEVRQDILSAWNEPDLAQILGGLSETDSGSSGQYAAGGVFGGEASPKHVDREMFPSEQIGMDETTDSAQVGGDSGQFAFDAPAGDGGDFWTAGNKLNKKTTKKELEEHYMNGFGKDNGGDYRSGFELDDKAQAEYNYHKSFQQMQNATSAEEQQMLAKKTHKRAKDMGVDLPKDIFGLNEDAKTQTQWENGSFVKIKEKCKVFPYCDQGPDAIETKKTATAVISDDVFETIANKTGRPVNEIKNIISNYKKK